MAVNLGAARRAAEACSFDLDSAANLFWAAVPALVHQAGRDSQRADLTVRILSGYDRHNPSSRVLRINLSSEQELTFLHTLEVGEDDFQALKADQGILVDYGSFPGKLVSLLQKCIDSREEKQPRYQTVLTCHAVDTIFRVVETNDFNQLPHITLAFRPGDDAAVKKFLAFRLSEVKAEGIQLKGELTFSQAQCENLQSALHEAGQQLTASHKEAERLAVHSEASQRTRDAAAAQARSEEVTSVREHADREREAAQQRHTEALSNLNQRLAELDNDNRCLREAKCSLDAKASELACRLGVAEGAARALEDESSHLRGVASTAARDRADRDAEAADLKARLRSADDKAQGQQQIMWEQGERIKGLEATVRHVEERCTELKQALASQETRARECSEEATHKSHALDKLRDELATCKEKLQRRDDTISHQEAELAARQAAMQQSAHESATLTHAHERLQGDLKDVQEERQQLKQKLEDSRQQLQGNEQMIRWLNNQVNEAQMQVGSMSISSRYSPRSSTLPRVSPREHLPPTGKPAAALSATAPISSYRHLGVGATVSLTKAASAEPEVGGGSIKSVYSPAIKQLNAEAAEVKSALAPRSYSGPPPPQPATQLPAF